MVWVGCPGLEVVSEEDKDGLTSALQAFNCVPIFLDPGLDHTFYFGFCRAYLWPTLHNVVKPTLFTQKVWRAYCTANRTTEDR